jgi:transcriptional regulator with XRE-family HTH domain
LTQEALAAEVGCSVFSIAKYERGERTPSIGMLRRIAAVTGYEIGWFFDEAEVA